MHQELNERDVLSSLREVLRDTRFLDSPKMTEFLKYVVLETLSGNSARIKAYTIAVDALNKPVTFDPQQNPLVRVMAKRLRDCLEDYYLRTSGHVIVFQFTKGSYVPTFVYGEAHPYVMVNQFNASNFSD